MNNFDEIGKVVEKPWGQYFTIHREEGCQVKRITIRPREQPSYQYHYHRTEDWFILSGMGMVTLNGVIFHVYSGSKVHIGPEELHTIKNIDKERALVFIEIQTGYYLGEDDIVRVADNYGRA